MAVVIEKEDIPAFHINSGMIIDEPGTGKTLQFTLYILETKMKAVISNKIYLNDPGAELSKKIIDTLTYKFKKFNLNTNI